MRKSCWNCMRVLNLNWLKNTENCTVIDFIASSCCYTCDTLISTRQWTSSGLHVYHYRRGLLNDISDTFSTRTTLFGGGGVFHSKFITPFHWMTIKWTFPHSWHCCLCPFTFQTENLSVRSRCNKDGSDKWRNVMSSCWH